MGFDDEGNYEHLYLLFVFINRVFNSISVCSNSEMLKRALKHTSWYCSKIQLTSKQSLVSLLIISTAISQKLLYGITGTT